MNTTWDRTHASSPRITTAKEVAQLLLMQHQLSEIIFMHFKGKLRFDGSRSRAAKGNLASPSILSNMLYIEKEGILSVSLLPPHGIYPAGGHDAAPAMGTTLITSH
jgi:hypothetical protein